MTTIPDCYDPAEQERKREVRIMVGCLLLNLGILAVLAAIAYGVNLVFDTNFMFLMYPIAGTPLVWFETHMGSHIWGFPILISAIIVVMYSGLYLYRKIKNKTLTF